MTGQLAAGDEDVRVERAEADGERVEAARVLLPVGLLHRLPAPLVHGADVELQRLLEGFSTKRGGSYNEAIIDSSSVDRFDRSSSFSLVSHPAAQSFFRNRIIISCKARSPKSRTFIR